MNLETLFLKAIDHRHSHDCSAYPYEQGARLIEYAKKYQPKKILEIGTGIGYTASIMALTLPQARILTLEKDPEHATLAESFIQNAGVSEHVTIVNEPAEQYLSKLDQKYDFIFFDGYQIHYEFLPHYERLLKPEGILFLANNHLKSKTSSQFFEELKNANKWTQLDQFEDTTIVQKVAS
jgi:predicted O-methyltransferase YrrM